MHRIERPKDPRDRVVADRARTQRGESPLRQPGRRGDTCWQCKPRVLSRRAQRGALAAALLRSRYTTSHCVEAFPRSTGSLAWALTQSRGLLAPFWCSGLAGYIFCCTPLDQLTVTHSELCSVSISSHTVCSSAMAGRSKCADHDRAYPCAQCTNACAALISKREPGTRLWDVQLDRLTELVMRGKPDWTSCTRCGRGSTFPSPEDRVRCTCKDYGGKLTLLGLGACPLEAARGQLGGVPALLVLRAG